MNDLEVLGYFLYMEEKEQQDKEQTEQEQEQLIKLIRNKHNSYETALDNKYGVAN